MKLWACGCCDGVNVDPVEPEEKEGAYSFSIDNRGNMNCIAWTVR